AAADITESDLLARRESYGPVLPDRVALLTAGVDIQADRAEISVFGWGAGEESWLMEHRVIPGDPTGPALWAALDAYLTTPWRHSFAGSMTLHAVCVDSGAFTGQVTRFCDERRGRRFFAIKGASGSRPVWPRRASKAVKGTVWVLGVDALRSTVQGRLKISEGPGRIHFPAQVDLGYFEQLNSEFVRTVFKRGRPERTWERRKGRRAEAWDCAVYALSGLFALGSLGIHVDVEAAKLENLRQVGSVSASAPYPVYRSKFMGAGP
ncbi:MAG: phage terminase large subunit family protein, partial [Acidobacteria bacterium]|nr:phage terminase large subunit family protein [Acidobacteriota bacterium]